MKLYLVHCGFYETELCEGTYESHVNFLVVAQDFADARVQAKNLSEFKKRKMHVDGLQEIEAVSGYKINLIEDPKLQGQSLIHVQKHRDLAPTPRSSEL